MYPDNKDHGPTWSTSEADRTQVGPCWPHEPSYVDSSCFEESLAQFYGLGYNFLRK